MLIGYLSPGELPNERDGDTCQKIRIIIKRLKETSLGVTQALFDPYLGNYAKTDNQIRNVNSDNYCIRFLWS